MAGRNANRVTSSCWQCVLAAALAATAASAARIPYCSVTDFGAKGDNRTEDTGAIQKALDSCASVLFPPPGVYLTRSLAVRESNLDIVIAAGATVIAWPDPYTYNTTDSVNALFEIGTGSKAVLSNITLSG